MDDRDLLREYARTGAEDAFAALVERHVGLVHSAALRQVRDAQLAEDVTQAVFIVLARKAGQVARHPGLGGWLLQTTRYAASAHIRAAVRRTQREQEAAMQSQLNEASPDVWAQVEPHLDEAMASLGATDRAVLALRYFENKTAAEAGRELNLNEEAARKRSNRALDKLRKFFGKKGVVLSAGAIAAAMSAHSVTAAPAGLAAAVTSAALSGTAATTATLLAATKATLMTTTQKIAVTAALTVTIGAGIYEGTQAEGARADARTLRQEQAGMADQIRQLQAGRDESAGRIAALSAETERLRSDADPGQLLRLRSEVGLLQRQLAVLKSDFKAPGVPAMLKDPTMKDYMMKAEANSLRVDLKELFKELKLTPEQTEQVVQKMRDLFLKQVENLNDLPKEPLDPAYITQRQAQNWADLKALMQPLLGEAGANRTQQYIQELPAHATVELLNGRLGATQLTDDQDNRLYELVKSEPYDLTLGISGQWDPAFLGPQTSIDDHLQQITESNQRILQKAGDFLAADQLTALGLVLSNGINDRISTAAALYRRQ